MHGGIRALVAGVVAVTGCATPFDAPSGPDAAIKGYYAAHASEEAGACPRPEIAAILDHDGLNAAGSRTTWMVRYSYFDPRVEAASDWPYLLTAERECTGFGEREFTLLERRTGYVVLDMSGERRHDDE